MKLKPTIFLIVLYKPLWYYRLYIVYQSGRDAALCCWYTGMKNEYKALSRESLEVELKKYKDIVEMFTNTVLGGIARMSLGDMHIINGTEGYYRMTGYSQEESLEPPFSNCGMNLVVPEDIGRIENALEKMLKENTGISINYRIRKKDGSIVWNSAFATGVQENEQGRYIDVFFLDITQEREQQRQNLLNEERFRIISEQTKDVVFEWEIEPDRLHYSAVFEKLYGPVARPRSTKELLEGELFHEEDKPIVRKIIEDLRTTMPYAEFKARLRSGDGSYFWALHRVTVIQDENAKPSHVVGIISNVTEFVENALDLQHKAEHDLLTGLLNRGVAQRLIEQILEQSEERASHAFIQFDIDRFKQINDFMGHAAGDVALQNIARQMREMFGNEDILVRMGGDEFALFLTNFDSRVSLLKRLEQFLKRVCCDFMYEEKIYPLSISIGAALYPNDGKTFQILYENADVALYRAKRSGGNRLEFFKNN